MTLNKNLNHHRKTADLARKVDDLARRYLNPKHPTPILREIILVPEQFTLLVDAITRQVSLIKCRSSSFEDGQVSIYDKALLWLTGMGTDPTNLGALEFYLTEFIGVVPICSLSEGKRAVESHIKLHGIITKKCMLLSPFSFLLSSFFQTAEGFGLRSVRSRGSQCGKARYL